MEIKPLKYFLCVADHLSFTRASQQLHIAQPAISMAIKKLEQEFGVALFHRYERKISLTDEGKVLQAHARRLMTVADETQTAMNELHDLSSGEVRVGIPSMLGSYYFPPILMAFKHRYPRLSLQVIEGGTWKLQQMLEAGEIDLSVIVAENPVDHLGSHALLKEQMMVTINQDHPFAKQSSVTPEQFFQQELVMFKEGYFHRKVIDRLAKQQHLIPNIGFETNLIPLIKSIVKQGFGVSTLLNMVIDDSDGLVTRPFSEPIWLDLNIAWRKDSYLSKANQTFLNFLIAQEQLK
ncbi:LysR substrate-binding domain-containing protein [Marinomonas ostreistagni]|uniref:LysR substrate-binding domain-containing protein n=1 Tax=Marinomonas ostreistagni TaxID=359209 RepID=UPI001950BF22|nr:LysR family transcriptional regulator [Marinomonas ostreistagni]